MPTNIATGHGAAKGGPHEEGELHVAHAHPRWIREGGGEEEAGGAEGADRPARARVERRIGREHDDAGREDDPVRDEPVLEVGRGDRDEREAEEGGDGGGAAEAELPESTPRRGGRSTSSTAG